MRPFDVQSIPLAVPAAAAFRFIADPSNLPRWTHAFKHADSQRATMSTPHGTVEIGLRVHALEGPGTIDWEMTFPDTAVARAYSRVVPNGISDSIYTFVLEAPPVAQALIEGTLAEQRRILADELQTLRKLLHNESAYSRPHDARTAR
jgi:hypothetical protein